MIVTQQVTFASGVWSPRMDCRADAEKYLSAARVMDNFIPLPQGGLIKRPGMEFRGKLPGTPTDGRLLEFEIRNGSSIIISIAGGVMSFWKNGSPILNGGNPYTIAAPWPDGSLVLLRWRMINDIMLIVHPQVAPMILARLSDTNWTLGLFVTSRKSPVLPENLDTSTRITATFKRNALAPTWGTGTAYEVGDRVKRNNAYYNCEKNHNSSNANRPEDKTTWDDPDEDEPRLLWTREFIDQASTKNQPVTLTSNKGIWTADHVGAIWELSFKRGLWDYESRLPVDKTATGSTQVTSKVLVVQGTWTMQTFGNWAGKFHVQISRDKGLSWKSLRAVVSTKKAPRNATFEGEEIDRALVRLMFTNYSANGTSGSPYAVLTVDSAYLKGVVEVTQFISSKQVKAKCITPVQNDTTAVWAEGAWSARQGFPRCIEFHQSRVVLAATARSPHTIWGSADDDYTNFARGTLATDPWAHTVMLGQREPIAWLLSDRQLLIGSSVGEFVMYGENSESPITPEDRNMIRHSSCGSHVNGPGVLSADSACIFVQHGGRIVREMAYRYESDRYEASNLTLLADHLFLNAQVTDFAIQREPQLIIWFVAGGKLFSLTYERGMGIAAWACHPTTGTVVSVACIRKSPEDEVWFIVNRAGVWTSERLAQGQMTNPSDDGRWSDCCQTLAPPYTLTGNPLAGKTVVGWNNGQAIKPATLNADFFTGRTGNVVVGLPYTAALQPMTPVIPLANGTSRSREIRIHEVVPNLWRSRGGKCGEDPYGNSFDDLRAGSDGTLVSGEFPLSFDGSHGSSGNFALLSDEPFPFFLRSLILKLNINGDAS